MDLLSGLKSFFKTDASVIDNKIFRLHYKGTAVILIAFSILVTGRQYIGDPIDCLPEANIPPNLLDAYCWIHTTFSVPSAWEKKVGDEVPYPGVAKYKDGEERVFHAYYQWVCFVLFLQAIMFYTPRYFWKAMEGGRIKNLILELNSPILARETKKGNSERLVEYLVSNMNNHRFYFVYYVIAEAMNFANVVGQIYLINVFLGGEFSQYGSKVIQFSQWDFSVGYDPMVKIFPRVTKCTFYKFGSGGSVSKHDVMCVLPINVINEKIYIFLWFWFVFLAFLSAVGILYRAIIVFWPESRLMIIRSRARLANRGYIETVVRKCQLGDWLVLNLLCKNLDSLNLRDVINELGRKFDGKAFVNV